VNEFHTEPKTQGVTGPTDVQMHAYSQSQVLSPSLFAFGANTPPRKHVPQIEPTLIGRLPDAVGESARQFVWLGEETYAFRRIVSIMHKANSVIKEGAQHDSHA